MTRLVVQIRVSEDEKTAWTLAAGGADLSKWMRKILNAAANYPDLRIFVPQEGISTVYPSTVAIRPPPLCSKCARLVRIGHQRLPECQDCLASVEVLG